MNGPSEVDAAIHGDPRFVAEFDVSRIYVAGENLRELAALGAFDEWPVMRDVLDALAGSLLAVAVARRAQGWTVMPAQQSLVDVLDAVERLVKVPRRRVTP